MVLEFQKALAKKLNLYSGSDVELNTDSNQLVVSKSVANLDVMLEQINSKNLHNKSFDHDS